ncbi:MAG: hypothetical protein GY820_48720 [Gammaproteobacteria bacterium]|nr:hypothetical protein [Gammaproteobacteria bacterium]
MIAPVAFAFRLQDIYHAQSTIAAHGLGSMTLDRVACAGILATGKAKQTLSQQLRASTLQHKKISSRRFPLRVM